MFPSGNQGEDRRRKTQYNMSSPFWGNLSSNQAYSNFSFSKLNDFSLIVGPFISPQKLTKTK